MKIEGRLPAHARVHERHLRLSKKYGENATTNDYNSGKAMIGRPYKFVEWVKATASSTPRTRTIGATRPEWTGQR
jgi:hypothetical protein